MGKNRILLPMADGAFRQLRLPLTKQSLADGPNWRAPGGGGTHGHVVWLSGDDFLATNGREGLDRYHMQELYLLSDRSLDLLAKDRLPEDVLDKIKDLKNRQFDAPEPFVKELGKVLNDTQLSRYREDIVSRARQEIPPLVKPMVTLENDIAGPPVVVARSADGIALRVSFADVRGTVYLYNFEDDALKLVRKWPLKGSITAGPFMRGDRIGVVVGKTQLVWLDPNKEDNQPVWTWDTPGKGIVGEPQLVEGVLLVADISGRFLALDPATKQVLGPGLQLSGSVGPAAAPVGYGAGMAFAPLTDGTVLLLPIQSVREPLPGLPPVW